MENKKRLIDVTDWDSFYSDMGDSRNIMDDYDRGYMDALDNVDDWMDAQPTVDAVEVVHGYWHIDDYDSGDPYEYAAFIEVHCSKCGYELGAESGQYGWDYGDPFPLKYCPNCGARMDGDENA